jgi:hypothetical protein
VKEYRIGQASPADAGDVYDFLFQNGQVHPDLDREPAMACWKQQMFGSPDARYTLLARDPAGNIVAHYGLIPFQYTVPSRTARGGFMCQLLVAPFYRDTDLFYQLERQLLREFKSHGFDFIYSLINLKPVLKAHLALGCVRGHDLHVYAFPTGAGTLFSSGIGRLPVSIQRLANFASATLGLGIVRVASAVRQKLPAREITPVNLDRELLAEAQKHWPIHALRNEKTIANRFAPFGRRRYRIIAVGEGANLGYIVLRQTRLRDFAATVVVDLVAPLENDRVISSLLLHACDAGLRAGSDVVMCLGTEGTRLTSALRANAFLRTPEFFTLICDPGARSMLSSTGSVQDWHLSWFDHDYV